MNLTQRPRRLRQNPIIRGMVRETRVSADTLIYPIFVIEGDNIKEEIPSMPGQYRYSIDRLSEELDNVCKAGVKSILLFGIPAHKDECGSSAWDSDGIVQRALHFIKEKCPYIQFLHCQAHD
jgi:porphobilinogen synthase